MNVTTPATDVLADSLRLAGEPPPQADSLVLERLADVLKAVRRACPDLPVLAIRWLHLKHPLHRVQQELLSKIQGVGEPRSTETVTRRSVDNPLFANRQQRKASRVTRSRGPRPPEADDGDSPARRGRLGWRSGRPREALRDGVFDRAVTRHLRSVAATIGHVGWCVVYAGSLSVRLAHLRFLMRRELAALARQRFEVIAKTCCIQLEPFSTKDDFYYGNLQERFERRGVRTLLLCGDIFDGDWRKFAKRHVSVSPPFRLPELCLVHPAVPLRLLWKQLVGSWRLSRLARRSDDPLVREVANRASRDCWLPDTAFTGLVFWIAREAVRIWHPRAFLTFYEGHAWERCAWWGAKDADSSCLTVGYQHGMVFRESLALTRPTVDLRPRSVPDIVLGLGEVPLELMRPGHDGYGVQMLPFGSFRYRDVAAAGPADPGRRTVLVTPEGHEPECSALFAFASACARRLPAYTFIFRMQPGVPLPEVTAVLEGYRARRSNIIISDEPDIADDYARSSILLYRGSSTVLYATLRGLLPVYVHIDTLIDVDPLYTLERWRRVCASPEEFAALAQGFDAMVAEQRFSEWSAAAAYLKRYAGPVQEGSVARLLDAVGFPTMARNGADSSVKP